MFTSGGFVCFSPDKVPPTVTYCTEELSLEAERLVQVNDHIPSDMFTGAASIVSNLDRKEHVHFLKLFE